MTPEILIAIAKSLEDESVPPRASMLVNEYIRNDIFQTIARGLRCQAEPSYEYAIVWDGGMSTLQFKSYDAAATRLSKTGTLLSKPNVHIERRTVGNWENA